ncbi:hypothetical protein M045_gp56 [Mycobacterium phage HINdeR]|uniref:Uncharacterized protein n=1 Tax=Mycobacterium phage HINdeR TaxID=1327770 RepID=R4JLJ3_9CAUD|nr:hypothetical protein M045_gp56 [Mycobacterium phage HINdeR]AGK87535.1 hypothetical protein PBI_HINDER_56 [Mycobacterium phage HINdeR]
MIVAFCVILWGFAAFLMLLGEDL